MKNNLSWIAVIGAGVLALVLAVALGAFQSEEASPASEAGGASVAEDAPAAASADEQIDAPPVAETSYEDSGDPGATSESPVASRPAEPQDLTVWELLSERAAYDTEKVILRGTILNLCVRGCQLTLDDGSGAIPVELVGDALSRTIPLRGSGRTIRIVGVFHASPRPHVTVEGPFDWDFD